MFMMSATIVDSSNSGRVVLLDAKLSICTDRKPDLTMFRMQVNTLHHGNKVWSARPKWMSAKFIAECYERAGLSVWDVYDTWLSNVRID